MVCVKSDFPVASLWHIYTTQTKYPNTHIHTYHANWKHLARRHAKQPASRRQLKQRTSCNTSFSLSRRLDRDSESVDVNVCMHIEQSHWQGPPSYTQSCTRLYLSSSNQPPPHFLPPPCRLIVDCVSKPPWRDNRMQGGTRKYDIHTQTHIFCDHK